VHFFPGLCLLLLGLALQFHILGWLLGRYRQRGWIISGASASTILLVLGYALEFPWAQRISLVTWC
jgi:hypothetical protein